MGHTRISGSGSSGGGGGGGGMVTDGDKGDITVSGGGTIWTIDANVVTFPKMQNAVASSRLVGSGSAGIGIDYTEIILGAGLSMTGTTLNALGTPYSFVSTSDPTYTVLTTPIVVLADPIANPVAITIPTAAPGNAGHMIIVKNVTSTILNLIDVATASGTIDNIVGLTAVSMNTARGTMQFISDGANWYQLATV